MMQEEVEVQVEEVEEEEMEKHTGVTDVVCNNKTKNFISRIYFRMTSRTRENSMPA